MKLIAINMALTKTYTTKCTKNPIFSSFLISLYALLYSSRDIPWAIFFTPFLFRINSLPILYFRNGQVYRERLFYNFKVFDKDRTFEKWGIPVATTDIERPDVTLTIAFALPSSSGRS